MTVQDLLDKIQQNCPPSCRDQILVSDKLTGDAGPVVGVRYRHTGKAMVLELVVDGDIKEQAA